MRKMLVSLMGVLLLLPALVMGQDVSCFMRGFPIPASGAAGEFSHAQLWNQGPRTVYVDYVRVAAAAPVQVVLGPAVGADGFSPGAPLPFDITYPGFFGGASYANGVRLDATTLSTSGTMRGGASTVPYLLAQMMHVDISPQRTEQIEFGMEPLPPGRGLTVRSNTVGADIRVSFRWCE